MQANLTVTLTGGEFVPTAEAMVGAIALRELENFHVRLAFIGTDGFSLEDGITANLTELAEVAKKVSLRSDENILVADSGKFRKKGFAHIQDIQNISTIITDEDMPEEGIAGFKKAGIKIVTV